jgi:1,4-dihydroxy-2-naphthoate polyprenyltransferase
VALPDLATMATAAQWIEGARPRTLPAAIAPVVAGCGVAAADDGFVWWKALLALTVALGLQIGVNYANDYSDGVRGTDEQRVGPLRLVGSRVATPGSVRAAAAGAFTVAAASGLVLSITTDWWLLGVGAIAIVAAWYYTGGKHPYGYRGLGEASVFVFFGLVAVVGTAYVQTSTVTMTAVTGGIGVGALACAILVANNLRDIPTDRTSGKLTLAVLLGDRRTRAVYAAMTVVAYAALIALPPQVGAEWWTVSSALPAAGLSIRSLRELAAGAVGPDLIAVLRDTGLAELLYAVAFAFIAVTTR